MPSKYPAELDALSTGNADGTKSEITHPALHNDANDAINKIEAELGTEPSGPYTTVKARLEALDLQNYEISEPAYGATTGSSDNQTAINEAIKAASEAGGGIVWVPIGEFTTSKVTMRSKVILRGAHPEFSVLKLKNSANSNLLETLNFGTSSQDFYGIENLTFNGNKANNASGGKGIASDGRRCFIRNVRVFNCKTDGIYHQKTSANIAASEGGHESLISDFYIWGCEGNGLVASELDTHYTNGYCIGNTKANILKPSSTGPAVFTNVHGWGACEYAWKVEDSSYMSGCSAEGASKAQVYIGFAVVDWKGGQVFRAGTPENVCGFELASESSGLFFDGYVEGTGTAGGFKFVEGAGANSRIKATFYDSAGGPAVTGKPNRSCKLDITLLASSTMGTTVIGKPMPKHLSTNPLRIKDLWRPEGTKAESLPRATTEFKSVSALASGTLYLHAFILPADETISTVHFYSSTGATTPENQYVVIADTSRKVLARSTDKTTTAWGNNAKQSFSVTYTPTVIGEDLMVYVGLMVKAATPPTLHGLESTNTFPHDQAPILCGASNTGLAAPSEATEVGKTLTAITATAKRLYFTVN